MIERSQTTPTFGNQEHFIPLGDWLQCHVLKLMITRGLYRSVLISATSTYTPHLAMGKAQNFFKGSGHVTGHVICHADSHV